MGSTRVLAWSAALAVGLVSFHAEAGTILHVDDDAPPGGDGTSWATAYRFLQDALADSSVGGVTEIRVGQGSYLPDRDEANPLGTADREATFQLVNGVELLGGFAGIGALDPDAREVGAFVTTLSGDLGGNDGPDFEGNEENAYNVVTGSGTDATAVLDGWTVTAGNADGLNTDPLNWTHGAGIVNLTGSPTVNDCLIVANAAAIAGAGMHNRSGSSPTLTGCRFEGNDSMNYGGGMTNTLSSHPTVTDCEFVDNVCFGGGGAMRNNNGSNSDVTNCLFVGNVVTNGPGGAMYNSEGSSPSVVGCTFRANVASVQGGAIRNFMNCSPVVTDCVFETNTALAGGAVHNYGSSSPTVINCTFSNNSAETFSGGLRDGNNCSSVLINCIFTGNFAGTAGGAVTAGSDQPKSIGHTMLNNCILWGNMSPLGHEIALIGGQPGSSITVAYSDVDGRESEVWVQAGSNLFWDSGNINADPLFVDPANGDYRLSASSPCIDAGDNTAVPVGITKDLDGNPRFADDLATTDTGCGECPIVDMGAHEFPASCPSDVDCDGNVGITDFLALLAALGHQSRRFARHRRRRHGRHQRLPAAARQLGSLPLTQEEHDPAGCVADLDLDGERSSTPTLVSVKR